MPDPENEPNFAAIADEMLADALSTRHRGDPEARLRRAIIEALRASHDRGRASGLPPDGELIITKPERPTLNAEVRPMTTAAESIRQLAQRIEARAKNDLLIAKRLRDLL